MVRRGVEAELEGSQLARRQSLVGRGQAEMKVASPFDLGAHQCRQTTRSCLPAPRLYPALTYLRP